MSKLFKLIGVLSIALIVFFNCSYVYSAVDMNLGNNTSSSNTSSSNTNSNKTTSTSSTISSTVTTSDFDLELTNILCITLIVVGILLILLGIAILIRLKK